MSNYEKQFESFARRVNFDDTPDIKHRDKLEQLLLENFTSPQPQQSKVWRIIMKSSFTKLVAAAVIIIAVVLGITIFEKSATPAYGIEQTVQASHSVRTLFIKEYERGESEPKEIWLECDNLGNVKRVRQHTPAWEDPGDGAKEIVWIDSKADAWLKKRNMLFTIQDQSVNERIQKLFRESDPRFAVENLSKEQLDGTVELVISRPNDSIIPIIVTATWTEQSATPNKKLVFYIDPKTKLVNAVEKFEKNDSEYQLKSRLEYYDYNMPIADAVFTLEEMPADVIRIDQTTQEIGLAKGDKSEEDIASEVARQFYEALIAGNYAKAGLLYQGLPADTLKKAMEGGKILRIVSIGKTELFKDVDGYKVPCKIEIEKDGKVSEMQVGIAIRQVINQPERWTICGEW